MRYHITRAGKHCVIKITGKVGKQTVVLHTDVSEIIPPATLGGLAAQRITNLHARRPVLNLKFADEA